MTNNEMRRIAQMQAEYLLAALKEDEEFLDIVFPSKYLSIEQASEFINMPIGTIYHKLDEIPHVKNGKRLVFSERALVRYIERQNTKGKIIDMKEKTLRSVSL